LESCTKCRSNGGDLIALAETVVLEERDRERGREREREGGGGSKRRREEEMYV
jgi:hypothetical protein